MAGHSKWKQIKRAKAITDQKRGAQFTKLGREITMAARQGGGDPAGNARLRLALLKAKEGNMPSEIVDRAIKKAIGDGDDLDFDEVVYEGYGPGGTAVMVEAVTDNRNRTVAEVRTAFGKGGGNMGESGSVGWMFTTRGVISLTLPPEADADEVALLAIDAGADDFAVEEDAVSVYTKPEDFENVRKLEEAVSPATGRRRTGAFHHRAARGEEALQTLRMLERLEDLDDVQRVFSNADFPEAALEAFNLNGLTRCLTSHRHRHRPRLRVCGWGVITDGARAATWRPASSSLAPPTHRAAPADDQPRHRRVDRRARGVRAGGRRPLCRLDQRGVGAGDRAGAAAALPRRRRPASSAALRAGRRQSRRVGLRPER